MDFEITVRIDNKAFTMQVRRIYEGDSIEKFAVSGGNRGLILKNNRPELKRLGTRKKPLWQIDEGEMPSNPQAFALTILAIEKKIEEIENPQRPYTHPKNL